MFQRFRPLLSSRYLIRRQLYRFIESTLAGRSFTVATDIGAGKSPYRRLLHADQLILIDRENRQGTDTVVIADITKHIPLADRSVDCILCTEVLEHLEEPLSAIREFYRILRPGGMLIATTPFVWPLHEEPRDFFRYTPHSLTYFFSQAGFTDTSVRPSNGICYTLCQLVLVPLRLSWLKPFVFLVNAIGYLAGRFEKNRLLPLSFFMIVRK